MNKEELDPLYREAAGKLAELLLYLDKILARKRRLFRQGTDCSFLYAIHSSLLWGQTFSGRF